MRLSDEGFRRAATLGLMLALAGCGVLGGKDLAATSGSQTTSGDHLAVAGPAADYPVVLGDAFAIDGIDYVPADVLNYDEVGYATLDTGSGVTGAHRTLPLPSYVEVTSLDTGRTILVRIERRGPMDNARLVALSAGAQAQLGVQEGAAIRVRRINPPETDRVPLRNGQPAPERLATPLALVEVLRRKLPAVGSASLNRSVTDAPQIAAAERARAERPDIVDTPTADVLAAFDAFRIKPIEEAVPSANREFQLAFARPPEAQAPAEETRTGSPDRAVDGFVVQAAAFSSEANARRAAADLDGFVEQSGRFYRVRVGPYSTRGQANAALAKVRRAGYSDAKIYDAG